VTERTTRHVVRSRGSDATHGAVRFRPAARGLAFFVDRGWVTTGMCVGTEVAGPGSERMGDRIRGFSFLGRV